MTRKSGLPESTEESRKEARKKALAARKLRAVFKDDIHAGKYTLTEAVAVAHEDPMLERMPVKEFLRAFVGMGPKKIEAAMEYAKIAQTRRLSGLSDVQLNRLVDWFAARTRR